MAHRAITVLTLFISAMLSASIAQSAEHSHNHTTPQSAPTVTHKPVLVKFPKQMREHTLANMRDHLAALAEIQGNLAAQHFDAASDIAEKRLGMTSLKLHGAHEVANHMPQGMQDAGTAMHRTASQFALIAQEAAVEKDLQKPLAALATLTQTCVSCHAAYRLH